MHTHHSRGIQPRSRHQFDRSLDRPETTRTSVSRAMTKHLAVIQSDNSLLYSNLTHQLSYDGPVKERPCEEGPIGVPHSVADASLLLNTRTRRTGPSHRAARPNARSMAEKLFPQRPSASLKVGGEIAKLTQKISKDSPAPASGAMPLPVTEIVHPNPMMWERSNCWA